MDQTNLYSQKLAGSKVSTATQDFLDIQEIRDGVVILRDGGLRKVLMVSSVNFDLRSEEEQQSIIYGFQSFINSLAFPVQIVIQSRKLDISDYLEDLKERISVQSSELMQIQTEDYVSFIEKLIEVAAIMSKDFYIIVPFAVVESREKGFIQKFRDLLNPADVIQHDQQKFGVYRRELENRAGVVAGGLSGMGLKVIPLETQEVIELVYNTYNPEEAGEQRLVDVNQLRLS